MTEGALPSVRVAVMVACVLVFVGGLFYDGRVDGAGYKPSIENVSLRVRRVRARTWHRVVELVGKYLADLGDPRQNDPSVPWSSPS